MRARPFAFIFASIALFGARPSNVVSPSQQHGMVDDVMAAERRFFATWYAAWTASQTEQFGALCGLDQCPRSPRVIAVHCHIEAGGLSVLPNEPERIIRSRYSAFSVCAGYPMPSSPFNDERIRIDNALGRRRQEPIRVARDSLIATIERAVGQLPQNDFLTGQLVRFLVDQGEFDRARFVTSRCAATAWWCAALRGFVLAGDGNVKEADSVFMQAATLMPPDVRCKWTSLTQLIDSDARKQYDGVACAKRDSLDRTIWWLADPLYVEPGNERRVHQFVRATDLALRRALDLDERYQWHDTLGNDARAELITRYGKPTYAHWRGIWEDTQHTGYLRARRSPKNEPYTSYEYSKGRMHTFPSAHALANALSATTTDWELTEAQKKPDPPSTPRIWWPHEHFAPRNPIVQLPDPQLVTLRRERDVLLAAAVDLEPALVERDAMATIERVSLIATPRPDSFVFVANRPGVVGAPIALWGRIPAGPTLVAIEFPALGQRWPGGRTRLGVQTSEPLTALVAGGQDISVPVVLQASSDGEAPPMDPQRALAQMAGSLRVRPVGRIGVYWETYGFAPADTVECAVWIERFSSQGIRRITNVVGLTSDLNTPVAVSWQETVGARRFEVRDGTVPIVSRTVSVDVSRLPKGKYWLDVAAKSPGRDVVRRRTQFVIQ